MAVPSERIKLITLLRIFSEHPRQLLYKFAPQIAAIYPTWPMKDKHSKDEAVFDDPEFAKDIIMMQNEWLIKVEGAAIEDNELLLSRSTAYDTWITVLERGLDTLQRNDIPLSRFGRSSRSQNRKSRTAPPLIIKTSAGMRDLITRKSEDLPTRATVNNIAASIAARQGQKAFRDELLDAYGGRCLVTGPNIRDILEAAHIQPYADGGPSELANGLLLRADIHTLFDLYLIAIDADMNILISPQLFGTPYADLAGESLKFPDGTAARPSAELLEKHRRSSGLEAA